MATSVLKTVGKGIATAVDVSQPYISAGMGTKYIADTVQEQNPEKIAISVVNTVGNVALDAAQLAAQLGAFGAKIATGLAASGGLTAILAIVQVVFMLIDTFVNPLKTYFNRDLVSLKQDLDKNLKYQLQKMGLNYPLEIKPDIIPIKEEDIQKLFKYKQKYYDDNGLISQTKVLAQEYEVSQLSKLKRFIKYINNPFYTNKQLYDDTLNNITLLIAAAAAKKKGYGLPGKIYDIDYKNYKPSIYKPYLNFIEINWQLIIICFLIIISISMSITFLF